MVGRFQVPRQLQRRGFELEPLLGGLLALLVEVDLTLLGFAGLDGQRLDLLLDLEEFLGDRDALLFDLFAALLALDERVVGVDQAVVGLGLLIVERDDRLRQALRAAFQALVGVVLQRLDVAAELLALLDQLGPLEVGIDVNVYGNTGSHPQIDVAVGEQLQTLESCHLASFFSCIEVSQVDVLPVVHNAGTPPPIGMLTDSPDAAPAAGTLPVLVVLLVRRQP